MGSYLHRPYTGLHRPYTVLHRPYTENVKGLTGLTVMSWQYFSLQYIEASEQWQITKDTDNKNDVTHWEYLDDACEALSKTGWKPILLSDHIILFRRKKEKCLKY